MFDFYVKNWIPEPTKESIGGGGFGGFGGSFGGTQ